MRLLKSFHYYFIYGLLSLLLFQTVYSAEESQKVNNKIKPTLSYKAKKTKNMKLYRQTIKTLKNDSIDNKYFAIAERTLYLAYKLKRKKYLKIICTVLLNRFNELYQSNSKITLLLSDKIIDLTKIKYPKLTIKICKKLLKNEKNFDSDFIEYLYDTLYKSNLRNNNFEKASEVYKIMIDKFDYKIKEEKDIHIFKKNISNLQKFHMINEALSGSDTIMKTMVSLPKKKRNEFSNVIKRSNVRNYIMIGNRKKAKKLAVELIQEYQKNIINKDVDLLSDLIILLDVEIIKDRKILRREYKRFINKYKNNSKVKDKIKKMKKRLVKLEDPKNDENQIEVLIDKFKQAIDTKDYYGLRRLYAPSAQEKCEELIQLCNVEDIDNISIDWHYLRVNNKTASLDCYITILGETEEDNIEGNNTVFLIKNKGKWYIKNF